MSPKRKAAHAGPAATLVLAVNKRPRDDAAGNAAADAAATPQSQQPMDAVQLPPPLPPRKRGRPRKHPLPLEQQEQQQQQQQRQVHPTADTAMRQLRRRGAAAQAAMRVAAPTQGQQPGWSAGAARLPAVSLQLPPALTAAVRQQGPLMCGTTVSLPCLHALVQQLQQQQDTALGLGGAGRPAPPAPWRQAQAVVVQQSLRLLVRQLEAMQQPRVTPSAKPTAGVSYVTHTESQQLGANGLPHLPHLVIRPPPPSGLRDVGSPRVEALLRTARSQVCAMHSGGSGR